MPQEEKSVSVGEGLEPRTLLTATILEGHPFFAPDTPLSVVEAAADPVDASIGAFQFADGNRWDQTANNSNLSQGDPTTITWSIAPDGTDIPGFVGESAASSDFVSFMTGIYGSVTDDTNYEDETWFPVLESVFERWNAISGLNYVYESNDDGAAFSASTGGPNGVVGIRGDVRIGGHFIDGNSGTLAYNFFPTVGDMVIDIGDGFFNTTTNNSLRFRNVISHELGHGIGINHVVSNDSAFLMEPFVSTSFDGPQLDDILAVQRGYGDANEPTGADDSSAAVDFGTLGDGDSVSIGTDGGTLAVDPADTDFVSIDDDSDVDFYQFTVGANSSVSVTLTPQGATYLQGPQLNSTQATNDAQETINTAALSDLTLEIVGSNGTTVLQSANANGAGSAESILDFDLPGAGTYFIRVTGADNFVQLYQLDTTVAVDAATSAIAISPTNISQAEGDAGSTTYTYTITRTGDLTAAAAVDFAVTGSSDSAANAADFGGSLPTGTVTLPANSGAVSFSVNVSGDVAVENDEEFIVTLSNASAGVSISTASATGTIVNDDTSYSISADSSEIIEGDSGNTAVTFTVTRNGDASAASTVDFAVSVGANQADADDFGGSLPSGTINFASNQTTAEITISVAGDLDVEDDESFAVDISNASDGIIETSSATATITNDDSDISVAAENADQNEGDTGNTAFTFTISRTGNTAEAQTVSYAVTSSDADVDDFAGNSLPSGTATIAADQSAVTLTIDVSGDSDVEADEAFTLTISNPSGNGEIVTDTASGIIVNDDVQIDLTLVGVDIDNVEGDTGTTTYTFRVDRTGDLSGTSSVEYSTAGSGTNPANSADFDGPTSGTVNFAANETSQTITLAVAGDTEVENDETFTVSLSNAVNAEITSGSVVGSIINDDTGVSISPDDADKAEGDSGTTAFTFTVTRSGVTTGTSSVDYTVSGAVDASDFNSPLTGTVTFAANETSKTITLDVVGDLDEEANEDFAVVLSNPAGATIINDSASGTIQNDDGAETGIRLVDGTLTIIGSTGNDLVFARGYWKTIKVKLSTPDSTIVETFAKSDITDILVDVGDGHDRVYLNGWIFHESQIELGAGNDRAYGGRGTDHINGGDGHDRIYGRNGNDVIDAGDGSDYVRGGNHNDIIHGGNGANRIWGDRGHDILVGGDQFDYLNGGSGLDLIIGGAGGDYITGRGGEDILITGSTSYDDDQGALQAILAAWTGPGSYATRINNMRTGAGDLNGVKLEANDTVQDDGVFDKVYGGGSKDWFFADTAGSDRDRVFRRFYEVIDALD